MNNEMLNEFLEARILHYVNQLSQLRISTVNTLQFHGCMSSVLRVTFAALEKFSLDLWITFDWNKNDQTCMHYDPFRPIFKGNGEIIDGGKKTFANLTFNVQECPGHVDVLEIHPSPIIDTDLMYWFIRQTKVIIDLC